MKNSLLAIALAVASMPLTFAAQTNKPVANPSASSTSSAPAAHPTVASKTIKTKKHNKTPKKVTAASTVKPK